MSHFDRVGAVEPQEAMRNWLRALCPHAHVIEGTAEQIGPGNASVDAVFAAEAFHKFDRQGSIREIARVLRPEGVLVLVEHPGRAGASLPSWLWSASRIGC